MARKKLSDYQKALRALNQRMKYLEQNEGYSFENIKIPHTTKGVKALNRKQLRNVGTVTNPSGWSENAMNIPEDNVAPTPIDVIPLVRRMIREYEIASNDVFLPSHDGKTYAQASTFTQGVSSFFDDLTINMDTKEIIAYNDYLKTVEDDLATLLSFNNIKYLDEAISNKSTVLRILNYNSELTSEDSYRYNSSYDNMYTDLE